MAPQAAHEAVSGRPHSAQNFRPARLSVPQCVHPTTPLQGIGSAPCQQVPAGSYEPLTRWSILNIGRYMAMRMIPTMIPTPIIMSGSMIEVSDATDASTSSS